MHAACKYTPLCTSEHIMYRLLGHNVPVNGGMDMRAAQETRCTFFGEAHGWERLHDGHADKDLPASPWRSPALEHLQVEPIRLLLQSC